MYHVTYYDKELKIEVLNTKEDLDKFVKSVFDQDVWKVGHNADKDFFVVEFINLKSEEKV